MKNKLNNPYILTSIALLALSLTQKCYCTTSNCADSIMVFLLGGLGMFSGGACLTWLANPLLILSWFTFKSNLKTAMWCSVAATLIAFSFLLFDTVLANESGGSQQIISYKSGYYLWVLSCSAMLVATYVAMYKRNVERLRSNASN